MNLSFLYHGMIKISWLYIIFLDALFLVPIVVKNLLLTVHLLRFTEMEPIDALNHVKTMKKKDTYVL